MKFRSIISLGLLVFTSSVYAILCPTNFRSITYGDSQSSVIAECGAPNVQRSYRKLRSLGNITWTYYVKINPYDKSTTKMNVVFQGDKVVNINIAADDPTLMQCVSTYPGQRSAYVQSICRTINPEAIGNVESTRVCGASIRIGDPSQSIRSICGNPVVIGTPQLTAENTLMVTEFVYNGPPMVILVFEEGRLADRR